MFFHLQELLEDQLQSLFLRHPPLLWLREGWMGIDAGKIGPPVSEKSTLVSMTRAQIVTMIPTSKCDSLVSGYVYSIYIYYVCVDCIYSFI